MTPLSRVALIDDDPDIREIARFALADLGGLEVRAWGDARRFLADLAAWPPQIVLLDLEMPGMDGWETVAALRAHPSAERPAVVLMSGRVEAAAAEEGIAGRIAKPFDPLALAETLRALWARYAAEAGE
ncbi:response regulator [Oleispirillum naphthae]|uniref:response regulator n=1 Tax=Oleispirillum naphthae TaxID=2838853 RepID=UPI0030824F92